MAPLETSLGLKLGALIGGFLGAAISLSFLQQITPKKAGLTVVAGTFTAGYITPIVITWLGIAEPLQYSISFLVGVFGMNILGGVFYISEKFKVNPETVWDLVLKQWSRFRGKIK